MPLPEGGWADDSTLEAAYRYYDWLTRLDRRRTTGRQEPTWPISRGSSQPTTVTMPTGSPTVRPGNQWRRYPATRGYSKEHSDAVGKFDDKFVASRFVEAVITKFEMEGFTAQELSTGMYSSAPRDGDPRSGELQSLQVKLKTARSRYENACAYVLDANDDSAEHWTETTDGLASEITAIMAAIADEESREPTAGPPPTLEIDSSATRSPCFTTPLAIRSTLQSLRPSPGT